MSGAMTAVLMGFFPPFFASVFLSFYGYIRSLPNGITNRIFVSCWCHALNTLIGAMQQIIEWNQEEELANNFTGEGGIEVWIINNYFKQFFGFCFFKIIDHA